MWSTGDVDEDSPSQRVVFAVSADGRSWCDPAILADDPDGPKGPIRRTAGGFMTRSGDTGDDALIAYFSTFTGNEPGLKWSRKLTLEACVTRDGEHWDAPVTVVDDFLMNEAPRRTPGDRLLMTGENTRGEPRILISESQDGVTGWRDARLPLAATSRHATAAPTSQPAPPPNEPTWFTRHSANSANGFELVLLFRDDGGSRTLFVSISRDDGLTWTTPIASGYPDATAKSRAGNLPDGRAYLINNPSRRFGRSPLVLATSADGHVFGRAWALRIDAARPRFEGKYKGAGFQYPGSLIWRDELYVIYSIAKEDVAITRVQLAELR